MIHGGWVRALACSPDGKALCAGGEDDAITCWDLGSGSQLGRWRGHASHVLSLAITPDSRRVVSASADTTLLVWDLPDGGVRQ
jgi:WD40 repeat protein